MRRVYARKIGLGSQAQYVVGHDHIYQLYTNLGDRKNTQQQQQQQQQRNAAGVARDVHLAGRDQDGIAGFQRMLAAVGRGSKSNVFG